MAADTIQENETPKLVQMPEGLTLVGEGMELRADFEHMLPRLRSNRLSQELLVKAARVKGEESPTALDATAGFGEDSLLLAAAGFKVLLCEDNPTIAALLRDALKRAAQNEQLSPIVARMFLEETDSVEFLSEMGGSPSVVYLDPMFPARTKSAAVKKKFQLLHHLEAPCTNEEELLQAALTVRPRKVVIKRPAKGEYLANKKPAYSVLGKAVRYDVLIPANVNTEAQPLHT